MFAGNGENSWVVYEDDDSDLVALLVVRDSLGCSRFDERRLPATGAGLLVDGMPRREVASLAAEWERWWAADTASRRPNVSHPLTSGVPSGPRLRAFLDQHWITVQGEIDRFRRQNRQGWGGADGDLTITRLMNEMESTCGDPPHSFLLRLEILPFAEPSIWRVTPAHYLVSGTLRRDQSAFADAMAPILQELGWGSG